MSVRSKKVNRLLILVVLLFVLVIGGLATYLLNKKGFKLQLRSHGSSINWPITGSFSPYFAREGAFHHQVFQDMKKIGMRTVILPLSLKTTCTPTADGNAYNFSFEGTNFDAFSALMTAAREEEMNVFLSDSFYSTATVGGDYCGNVEKFAQTQINIWQELRNKIGPTYFDDQNFVQGFYLRETNVKKIINYPYYKLVSQRVKSAFPGKLTMISPWPNVGYGGAKEAATNLFSQTSVDILAPQDGVGACLISVLSTGDVFRGYRDAVVNFPGRQVWANVETFEFPKTTNPKTGRTKCDSSSGYYAASFNRVRQQIEAVMPYVSKIITWMYADTMATTPALSDWGTPGKVALKAKLRTAYEQYYGGVQPVLTPLPTQGSQIPDSIKRIIKRWKEGNPRGGGRD